MKIFRILVCGDRHWKNYKLIRKVLKLYKKRYHPIPVKVIDGMASGADSLGHKAARSLKMETRRFKADWDKFGRSAGPIRNRKQLKKGKPHLVIAFHNNLKKSKGTKDMLNVAAKAHVPIVLYKEN